MENSGSTTIDRHQQVEEVSPTNKPKAMAAMAEREPRPKPEQVEEVSPTNKPKAKAAMAERKPWPKPEQKVDCPRCKSPNTKFSYYNNYNMSQPRYFCKACRRYWTHGGSLRNVPIGGRCRKIRQSEANNNNLVAMVPPEPMVPPPTCMGFPNVLPTFISAGFELPSIRDRHLSLGGFVPSVAPSGTLFLDVLRGGVLDGGYGVGNNGMVQMPPLAMTYGSTMQHGTIGGATVAQGAVNGTMSVIEEGGLGDGGDMKRMMGIQWQHLNGGIGLGSGTNVELQQQGNVSNSVNSGGSSSRDCNWNNGGWQSLINSSSSG